MSKLILLVKTQLQNTFEINNFFNKKVRKDSKKNFAMGSSLIVALAIVATLVTMYFGLMAKGLKAIGMLDMLLLVSALACVAISFFTSIYKAQGILFASRDFEALAALPIKSEIILASKMIELLILNYLFVAVVIIPSSIVYFINGEVNPIFFLYGLIGLIFIPLLPIVIASILAFGLSYISSKFKFKNAVLIVTSVLLTVGIMWISFKANELIAFVMAKSDSIYQGIKSICPPIYYYADMLSNLNIKSMFMLIIWSVIPFVFFTIIFGRSFKKINSKMGDTYKKSNYKLKSLKKSSKVGALLKREARGYFSSAIYLLNTSIGMILITVAALIAIFMGADKLLGILAKTDAEVLKETMPNIMNMLQFLPLALLIFGVSLTCTTGSSISLEGRNLWILKSSPLRAKDIFLGKIGLNLLIVIPLVIIDTILFSLAIKITAINVIFTLVISILMSILVAVSGIIINLYFPKLNWVNQTQVVKQSISSFLSMFLGMLVTAVSVGICILVNKIFKITNIYVYLSGITLLLTALTIGSITILRVQGERLFNKL